MEQDVFLIANEKIEKFNKHKTRIIGSGFNIHFFDTQLQIKVCETCTVLF